MSGVVIPKKIEFINGTPRNIPEVYECSCGHRFNKLEFIRLEPIGGTREYCLSCKSRFIFVEETK